MAEKYYKDTIWTNHALQRLSDRRLTQQLVYKAFISPDKTYTTDSRGTEYVKRFGIHTVTAIMKKSERGEWLVISCWMNPPARGTEDEVKKQRYYKYINGSLLTKLRLQLSRMLFKQEF